MIDYYTTMNFFSVYNTYVGWGGGDAQTPTHTTQVKQRWLERGDNQRTNQLHGGGGGGGLSLIEPLLRVYLTGTSFTPTHTYYTHTHTQKSLTENVP